MKVIIKFIVFLYTASFYFSLLDSMIDYDLAEAIIIAKGYSSKDGLFDLKFLQKVKNAFTHVKNESIILSHEKILVVYEFLLDSLLLIILPENVPTHEIIDSLASLNQKYGGKCLMNPDLPHVIEITFKKYVEIEKLKYIYANSNIRGVEKVELYKNYAYLADLYAKAPKAKIQFTIQQDGDWEFLITFDKVTVRSVYDSVLGCLK